MANVKEVDLLFDLINENLNVGAIFPQSVHLIQNIYFGLVNVYSKIYAIRLHFIDCFSAL